jgi:hypothetical protein
MTRFDERWKICANHAGRAPEQDLAPPCGFATRVVARVAASKAGNDPVRLDLVLQQLTVRLLGLVCAFLILCAALEVPHLGDRKPLDPGIENAVAQLVWNL